MKASAVMLIVTLGLVTPASAQSLDQRVSAVQNGDVRFSFPARDGICGVGRNSYRQYSDSRRDWESDCDHGPVRIALRVDGGEVTDLDWYVGGRWRSTSTARDLGDVTASDATAFLTALFADQDSRVGRSALEAAGLGDSDANWQLVVRVARNDDRSDRSRKTALTWLAGVAGRRLGETPVHPDEDVRKRAVFALSQLPREQSIPRLVSVVESNRSPGLRRSALFWLGQSGDERAIAVIERILRSG